MLKTCDTCGKEKEEILDNFYKARGDKFRPKCKDCHKEDYKDDAPKIGEAKRERYRKNPDRAKNTMLKCLHKITLEEFRTQLSKQNGVCALCFRVEDYRGFAFSVDHDHSCALHVNKTQISCKSCIRGLLCWECNRKKLPWLERTPHLQNDFIKRYLAQRPFLQLTSQLPDQTPTNQIEQAA